MKDALPPPSRFPLRRWGEAILEGREVGGDDLWRRGTRRGRTRGRTEVEGRAGMELEGRNSEEGKEGTETEGR